MPGYRHTRYGCLEGSTPEDGFTHLGRKALQPPPQSIASALANVCGKRRLHTAFPASTCNHPRKYVRLRSASFRNLPHVFPLSQKTEAAVAGMDRSKPTLNQLGKIEEEKAATELREQRKK